MTGTVLRVLSTPAARIVMTIVLLASILMYVLSYTPAPKTGSWDFTARALLALGSSTSPSADSLTQAILTMQAMMLEIRDTLVTPTLTDGEIRA